MEIGMTFYLGILWLVLVAVAGYALGYNQPKINNRKAWLFFTTLFFTLMAPNLLPLHPKFVFYRVGIFLACWIFTLVLVLAFTSTGRNAMERRVSKHTAFLQKLG